MRNDDLPLPPLMCTDCVLGRLAIYGPTKTASPDQILSRRRKISTYPPRKTLLHEGEPLLDIHTIYSGWAYCLRVLSDGRRHILSFLIPGDVFPLVGLYCPGHTLPFSVKSLTTLSLCTFAISDMNEVLASSEQQRASLAGTAHACIAEHSRRVTDIGQRSAVGRVAQLILELERRLSARGLSNDGSFDLPARQQDLADALGLTTVYINRTLDCLRKDRIIAFERGQMAITDFEQLRKIADEE